MASWYQKTMVPRLLNAAMSRTEFEKIRPEVLADASGVVLEIGVGAGHNLPLYTNVSKLYALEPFPELVALAKTRAQSLSFPVEFLVAGAEHIPLPDKSVDTVVSTWTLCSVGDPQQVLHEIARVLRPQGSFVFVDHDASPNKLMRAAQTMGTSVTKYFTGNCHYNRPIEKLLTMAGFTITKMAHPSERFKPLIYNYQGVATLAPLEMRRGVL